MATAKKTTARKASAAKKTAPAKPATTTTTLDPKLVMLEGLDIPKPKGTTKDGISYTKDFDAKFLKAQHDLLVNERIALLGQASRLEDEANSLIEDNEMSRSVASPPSGRSAARETRRHWLCRK